MSLEVPLLQTSTTSPRMPLASRSSTRFCQAIVVHILVHTAGRGARGGCALSQRSPAGTRGGRSPSWCSQASGTRRPRQGCVLLPSSTALPQHLRQPRRAAVGRRTLQGEATAPFRGCLAHGGFGGPQAGLPSPVPKPLGRSVSEVCRRAAGGGETGSDTGPRNLQMNKQDSHTSTAPTLPALAAPPGSGPAPSRPRQGQRKQVKSRRKEFLAEDCGRGESQPLRRGAAPGELSLQAAPRCPKRVQRGPQGWRPMGTDERKGRASIKAPKRGLTKAEMSG